MVAISSAPTAKSLMPVVLFVPEILTKLLKKQNVSVKKALPKLPMLVFTLHPMALTQSQKVLQNCLMKPTKLTALKEYA